MYDKIAGAYVHHITSECLRFEGCTSYAFKENKENQITDLYIKKYNAFGVAYYTKHNPKVYVDVVDDLYHIPTITITYTKNGKTGTVTFKDGMNRDLEFIA